MDGDPATEALSKHPKTAPGETHSLFLDGQVGVKKRTHFLWAAIPDEDKENKATGRT